MSIAALQQLSTAANRLAQVLSDIEKRSTGQWTPYSDSELRYREKLAREELTAALAAAPELSAPAPQPEPAPRRGRPRKQCRELAPVGWDVQPATQAERPCDLVPIGARLYWRHDPAFGAWLRAARDEAGMSCQEAAGVLGLSQPALSRLENGETARIPPIERLLRLAERFGVAPQEMLHRAGICVGVPAAREPDDALARLSLEARAALSVFLEMRWGRGSR